VSGRKIDGFERLLVQVSWVLIPKWVQNLYRNKKAYSSEFQKGGAQEKITADFANKLYELPPKSWPAGN